MVGEEARRVGIVRIRGRWVLLHQGRSLGRFGRRREAVTVAVRLQQIAAAKGRAVAIVDQSPWGEMGALSGLLAGLARPGTAGEPTG